MRATLGRSALTLLMLLMLALSACDDTCPDSNEGNYCDENPENC